MSSSILLFAMFGTVCLGLYRAVRDSEWRRFVWESCALLVVAGFLYGVFGFPFSVSGDVPKGAADDWTVTALLFLAMLVGAFAQLLYAHFSLPPAQRRKRRIDWGSFLAAAAVSPISFIPLLMAFDSANVNVKDFRPATLAVFLVAFQNGFFWREHYERTRKEVVSS